MKHNVEAIVAALNSAQVRYFIAGGLAVVAHGFVRFTADVDLILDLDVGNLGRAIEALEKPGYRPRAPVPLRDFKVPEKREEWVREKARFGPQRVSMLPGRRSRVCRIR